MTMNCHHASARSVARTGSAPTRWTSTASRIAPARRSSRLRNLMIEAEAVDRTIIPLGTDAVSDATPGTPGTALSGRPGQGVEGWAIALAVVAYQTGTVHTQKYSTANQELSHGIGRSRGIWRAHAFRPGWR